jgi:MoaA/NifB/PqqE/SkfB family radical SAM enzyme
MPEHCQQSGCDDVHVGLFKEAESIIPAYDLIPNCSFCVIHASRGCVRKCSYCYVHKIEPKFEPKRSIKRELVFPNVSFLDNNFLGNPFIKDILNELIEKQVKSAYCLSGVDAAFVTREIAQLMFNANFKEVRISFDRADEQTTCERAIDYLEKAGYQRKEISVFTLYNYDDPFEQVEKRRMLIKNWGVHIISQRYIPIPSLSFNYLHPNWTEEECDQFIDNCHKQSLDLTE